MAATPVAHALGLHMHQPPENLRFLIDNDEREAERIIRCYDRAQRWAHACADGGRLHVSFSGILLEQLLDPAIVDLYRRWLDIPAMLDGYRTADNIEVVGTGYYHPIFPLIPMEDWEDQLIRERRILETVFGRAPKGFWPPNMGFCMEMIPALAKAGYTYVIVDGVYVQPTDGVLDIYRPYRAIHDGCSIAIIPRERHLSCAQGSGMDLLWFTQEAGSKIAHGPRPHTLRLLTTWSDGENGGWFRETCETSGFFGRFFAPYAEAVRSGGIPLRLVMLSNYLDEHPPTEDAAVQTGAWDVGSTSGVDFRRWSGSEAQRRALAAIGEVSGHYWRLMNSGTQLPKDARNALACARTLILEGEASCFLDWGESRIPKLYERTVPAKLLLLEAEAALAAAPKEPARHSAETAYS
jgi:hypothetical protein